MLRRTGEYLWRQDIGDGFRLRTQNPTSVMGSFRDFLKKEQPDVVFLHHYVHIGVRLWAKIKLSLPNCLLVVTLRIRRHLQSQRSNGEEQYEGATARASRIPSNCFPERTPQDFWLRKHYIQKNFEFADAFVAPSEFLRQRYVDWGIPAEHIVVIENDSLSLVLKAGSPAARLRARFGFFGQITEYKGVEILLQAIHLISNEIRTKMIFEVHGPAP